MRKYAYIMSSERADRRDDEACNTIFSDRKLHVGDSITLDGLKWTVDAVCDDLRTDQYKTAHSHETER